jgi:hypothetical protein
VEVVELRGHHIVMVIAELPTLHRNQLMLTYREKKDRVSALTTRYVLGELSEPVYTASLKCRGLDRDDIRYLVMLNRIAHRSSLPYRRGDVA